MEEKRKKNKAEETEGIAAENAVGRNPTENDVNRQDATEAATAEANSADEGLTAAFIRLSEDYRRQSERLEEAARTVAELKVRAENAENELNRLGCAPPDYDAILSDERFIDEYAVKCAPLRTRIIADYLIKLNGDGAVSVLGGAVGNTPLTPVAKPKSLSEAKRLAEILIKGQ